MKQKKVAVLLINLGTPQSPNRKDVRKYLTQFLNDKRIISIPWIFRTLLVNGIIIPFRTGKSTNLYQKLWTENGSPLLFYGNRAKDALQEIMPQNYTVDLAMRYGEPAVETVLKRIEKEQPEQLIVVPMYPQYASSTTGSCVEKVMQVMKSWNTITTLKIVPPFYSHQGYIDTIVNNAKQHNLEEIEHFVFSFHGLPLSHIQKIHDDSSCEKERCKDAIHQKNHYCYQAQCYETARLLAKELNIDPSKYTVTFQSRINKKWLQPFTDHVLIDLAQKGNKKVMIFSPSFVADCLETIVEIQDEYQQHFLENGGEELVLVESLNDNPRWISCLKEMITTSI